MSVIDFNEFFIWNNYRVFTGNKYFKNSNLDEKGVI